MKFKPYSPHAQLNWMSASKFYYLEYFIWVKDLRDPAKYMQFMILFPKVLKI